MCFSIKKRLLYGIQETACVAAEFMCTKCLLPCTLPSSSHFRFVPRRRGAHTSTASVCPADTATLGDGSPANSQRLELTWNRYLTCQVPEEFLQVRQYLLTEKTPLGVDDSSPPLIRRTRTSTGAKLPYVPYPYARDLQSWKRENKRRQQGQGLRLA